MGSLKLPEVDVVGDVGAQINSESIFAVADVVHLTDFTKVRVGCNSGTLALNLICFVDVAHAGGIRMGYFGRECYR